MRKQVKQEFLDGLWRYYDRHGRHDLPWRLPEADGSFDAYKILVSEVMLQQTQVGRVIPKYHEFLAQFPGISALAAAPLSQVLKMWSGLGYNRRAKFLWLAAQLIVDKHTAVLPQTLEGLVALPGIGHNSAGAIMAYAFNQPAVFVETNIRTVYIHHFFADRQGITDTEIRQCLEATLDPNRPREFYWALMDYGSYLKATIGNLNKLSNSYSKQSPFAGSKRQIRGRLIRLLTSRAMTLPELQRDITDVRLEQVLADLIQEDMIEQVADSYSLR